LEQSETFNKVLLEVLAYLREGKAQPAAEAHAATPVAAVGDAMAKPHMGTEAAADVEAVAATVSA
jgi:hypothetical protein